MGTNDVRDPNKTAQYLIEQDNYFMFESQNDAQMQQIHMRKSNLKFSSVLNYVLIPHNVHWRESLLKLIRRLESSGIPSRLFTIQEPFDTSVNPFKRIDDSNEVIRLYHLLIAFHIFQCGMFCSFVLYLIESLYPNLIESLYPNYHYVKNMDQGQWHMNVTPIRDLKYILKR